MGINSRLPSELREKARALYISSASASQIAEQLQVKLATVKRWAERGSWGSLRQETNDLSEQKIRDEVINFKLNTAKEYVTELVPKVVAKTMQALDSNELTGKECLSNAVPLLKLLSSLTGEIENNTVINIGELFARLDTIDPALLPDVRTNYTLIE